MWLMASEIPVRLEILDQAGQRVFDAPARLTELDETHALMCLEEPQSAARLHWGSPVRFELEDGMRRYEITGAIVARQEEESSPETAAGEDGRAPTWELRVRIWECKLNVQRRTLPRRKLKFRVQVHPAPVTGDESAVPGSSAEPVLAWCMDIGAGGIRIRTDKLATVPPRLGLEFCLPVSDGANGVETSHKFCLVGRVIRTMPHGRHGTGIEIALCFEGLSVRDGMVLHNLLT
jgi:hypothetical protein